MEERPRLESDSSNPYRFCGLGPQFPHLENNGTVSLMELLWVRGHICKPPSTVFITKSFSK